MLSVWTDADASHAVSLVEHGGLFAVLFVLLVALAVVERVVELILDKRQFIVHVEGLDEILAVDVAAVDRVGGHVGTQVPDTDGIVRTAGDERTGRQNGLRLV